jgi:PAS domain S-box-containing protein
MTSAMNETHSRPVIAVDPAACVNCHRCIAACPVKFCNDGSGDHVAVDADLCIGCGACVVACTHDARLVRDDLQTLLDGLGGGQSHVAIVAPSAAAVYGEELPHLLGWLRSLGIAACFDVSYGAELTVRSALHHLDTAEPRCVITQPCPVIVDHIELHHPELLPHLAPVDSPMAHTVRMIREFWPQFADHRIVAISPCAAKAREFDALGLPVLNVTFGSVARLLASQDRELTDFPTAAFDGPVAGVAVGFSSPGGLVESLVHARPDLRGEVRTLQGPEVHRYLADLPAAIAAGEAPRIVDVLSCPHGCNGGVGTGECVHASREHLEARIRERRDAALARMRAEGHDAHDDCAEHWRADLYVRRYRDRSATLARVADPGEEAVAAILTDLGRDPASQPIDCGACGYGRCRDMARAIHLGLNRPENCHVYLREEHATDLFEGLHTGLMTVDRQTHRIVRVNAKFAAMVGLPPEEIVGRHCQQFVCPNERGHCPITDRGLKVNEAECVLLDAGGREIPVIKTVSEIHSHGRALLLENITSIADRKQLEHDLAHAADQARSMAREARRACQAKSEFLANMSHEIRTPLNAILGMAQLLQQTAVSPEQRQYLDTMAVSGETLLGLISDILDFSRIESGRVDLDLVDLDLREIVAEVVTILDSRAAARGLTLEATVAPNVPRHLHGDAGRTRQILLNLVGNAIKFTDDGGVVITAEVERQDGAEVVVRLTVRDTGIGIAADAIDGIFDSFRQLDGSATRRHGGSGLGLAITRQLVELMDGQIEAESTVGEGSTFRCTLAMREVAEEADESGPPPPEPGVASGGLDAVVRGSQISRGVAAGRTSAGEPGATVPSATPTAAPPAESSAAGTAPAADSSTDGDLPPDLRVLLVEDNRINQVVALRMLEKTFGVAARAVSHGGEALEELAREDYDLVLMDCHMPVLDGLEATRRIRDPQSGMRDPAIPIVAMTANAVKGAREECLDAGMNDYVPKPVNAAILRSAMHRVLRDRRTAAVALR